MPSGANSGANFFHCSQCRFRAAKLASQSRSHHGARMRRCMVIVVPELTGYAGIRYVWVSLPYVAALVDGRKYMNPADVKLPEGTELRRQHAPRGSVAALPGQAGVAMPIGGRTRLAIAPSIRAAAAPGDRNRPLAPGRGRQIARTVLTRPHCTVIPPRRLKARLVLVG
jgi:hypothetical protein